MVQYVITPWRNPSELLCVRQQLYQARNDDERRQAVAQVSVWMQRGNCPHLVESTAILTSAILNDVSGNSTYCVRAAYSAAFCRFVTGLLDSHQDGRKKLSMYSIAKKIGLPATYVELRHQATHEELPSLSKLRTATQKSLRWIWDYYWLKLSVTTPSRPEETCTTYVRKIVEECDYEKREKMELNLRKWDERQLTAAVLEIQTTAENSSVLLRALQLQQRLLSDDGEPSSNERELAPDSPVKSLEDMKSEMAEMENDLASEVTDATGGEDVKSTGNVANLSGKGWALWEGPWIPKPIGVV